MLKAIKKHGWYGLYVFDPENIDSDFSYTVGFSKTLNSPELIIAGFPKEIAHHVFWEMFRQIQAGEKLEDGKRCSGLLEGHVCISKKATHPELHTEYVTSVNWFWKRNKNKGYPQVYQIVWPGSKNGLFPWEDGCNQSVIDNQTKLWT